MGKKYRIDHPAVAVGELERLLCCSLRNWTCPMWMCCWTCKKTLKEPIIVECDLDDIIL